MRTLLLILLAGSVLAASAAQPADKNDIGQSGFVYCVNGVLTTFNPQLASGGLVVDTLASQIYDRLLRVASNGFRLQPELAQRWEVSGNNMIFRFHLRHDVSFQKTAWFTPSRTMNADDVVFSFQRVFDRNNHWHNVHGGRYPYFDSLQFTQKVKSVHKIDPYTVEITLKEPDISFLWHLATNYAPVLSAEYAAQLEKQSRKPALDNFPVGTGPFLLQEYRPRNYIRLVRNPSYWQQELPRMEQVVIDIGVSGTGRISKLLTGECDVLAWPSASQISVLRDDPRLRLTLRPSMNIAYLAFNTSKAPLNRSEVRHALALAINNDRLMESVYYGTAETAASIIPRASWGYDNEARITRYNPKKAREILKSLGIRKLRLSLWVPPASEPWNPSPQKTAEIIQSDLDGIGVHVTIHRLEGHFQQAMLMDKNHDLTLSGWNSDSDDPNNFFRPLLSCAAISSGTNIARWCYPPFDALLQQGSPSHNLACRRRSYHYAQMILTRELPVLPLASSLHLLAYRHDIQVLELSTFGSALFAGVYRCPARETP